MPLALAVTSFIVLGSGVKYIDAAFDDGVFPKTRTVPFALSLGGLAGACMIWDHNLLLISLSILAGVFITGKLDILPFRLLALTSITVTLVYFKGVLPLGESDWSILALLSSGAALDEVGNDLADSGVLRGRLAFFFLNRGYLKLLTLTLVTLKYFSLSIVMPFLGFDFGYLLFTLIAQYRVAALRRQPRPLVP